jgi:apolipoprotein N-acyltransferase
VVLLTTPILTGTTLRTGEGARDVHTNSAVLFAGGAVRGIYDKVHPLAFGETVPFGDALPALRRWLPNAGRITAGTRPAALALGDHVIAPLICYEDILAGPANRAVTELRPDLLVNLTNDSWFGDSNATYAHLALAQFRAVEHRRFLVHAASTGVSAFVEPTGRAFGVTPRLAAATGRATLRWMQADTPYERLGDAPWFLAAAAIVAMAFVPRRRFRQRAALVATAPSGPISTRVTPRIQRWSAPTSPVNACAAPSSHSHVDPSSLPDATVRPSGDTSSVRTSPA